MWHAVAFDVSIFFASCLTLPAGNLSRSKLLLLMVFDTNSSSFKKNQKMSWCKMFAVSWGHLARHTWACTALYHSSTNLLLWQKLVSRSNFAHTSFACGLQNSTYLDQIVSRLSTSAFKHQETYWSIPKSPLHVITFLYFFDWGSTVNSQSKMFSHFIFHFKKLWYKPSLITNPSKGLLCMAHTLVAQIALGL